MESKLICADDLNADNGRIYYLSDDNSRHWIPSPDTASSYDWDLSTVTKLPIEEVFKYPLSFSVARRYEHIAGFSMHLPCYSKSSSVAMGGGGVLKELHHGAENGSAHNSKVMGLN